MNKGFTLVELLVSISIFTLITSVAVYNHAKFNNSVLLTNLAYEIGLSVRQAQFYGISVRQNASFSFNSGYGVHFNPATPTAYTLFEDKTGGTSHVWDSGEDLQNFTISKGNKILKVCVDGNCNSTIVDISFIRPNPDAFITTGGSNGSYKGEADICVASPDGTVRKVIVESTGQISVGTDDAPNQVCN